MVVGKVARNTMSNQVHCSRTEHIALNRKRWQFPNPPGIGCTSLQCGSTHCTEMCSVQKHSVEVLQISLKYHIIFFILVHAIAYSHQSLVCAWITKHHPPWAVDWVTTLALIRIVADGNKPRWTAMVDNFIPSCSMDDFLMAVRTSRQTDKSTDK